MATYQIMQIVPDIDGEAAGELFGFSVSMSANGTTFVVGAPGHDGINGTDSGRVRVYKFNSTLNTSAHVGLDIDGEAASDEFGRSVSMSGDGTTFVVSAQLNDGINGTNSGHLRVYKFNSALNTYAQVGLDIDGEAAGDWFGLSVSMSADGTTFVVGAYLNDGVNGTDSGHVRVYKNILVTNSPTLTPTKAPTKQPTMATYQIMQIGPDIDGEASEDSFGDSVSMSRDGTTFVVGAELNDGINDCDSGHVRVYKFNSTINTFAQIGLDVDGESNADSFGTSVSMSADGTTFVVGARYNFVVNGAGTGYVRVYKFNSTINMYSQFGLDIFGETDGELFGTSVSMSADGTTFVVGAIFNDGLIGYVRVYKLNSTINTYAQIGMDIDGEANLDNFGYSVSMSGDGITFVVGAPFNGINGANSGHVRVFKFNSTINMYDQVGLDIDGEAAGDLFGSSVSMSADGTTFVVGATGHDGINGTDSGHVRVYKFNSTLNTYTQLGLDLDGEAAGDLFGRSVSMSGDGTTFVVGATLNDGINGTDSGHVLVYKFNSALNTYAQVGLDIDGEAEGDWFGRSVSMSADGTTFVVGALFNDGINGTKSGHVRVYRNSLVTKSPTLTPPEIPTVAPTKQPTLSPTKTPTKSPTLTPTKLPTEAPTQQPTKTPTKIPTVAPTKQPTKTPTKMPTKSPTKVPTDLPSTFPSSRPVTTPVKSPIPVSVPIVVPPPVPVPAAAPLLPVKSPSAAPTTPAPVVVPVSVPVQLPVKNPSKAPVKIPSTAPAMIAPPTTTPTAAPENCGLWGWNLFCPRRGQCGLIKRLLNIGNCD